MNINEWMNLWKNVHKEWSSFNFAAPCCVNGNALAHGYIWVQGELKWNVMKGFVEVFVGQTIYQICVAIA